MLIVDFKCCFWSHIENLHQILEIHQKIVVGGTGTPKLRIFTKDLVFGRITSRSKKSEIFKTFWQVVEEKWPEPEKFKNFRLQMTTLSTRYLIIIPLIPVQLTRERWLYR